MEKVKLLLASTLVIVLTSLNFANAQPTFIEKVEAIPGSSDVSYERWELSNGLRVLIHEDHSDPIVHIRVTYHVGSSRETPGKSGFAHFFEHMMFQGSDNVGDEEHFKIVNEAGGNMNGFTTSDNTVYFETVPSNQMEVALWLEADRMGFLLDAVTQEKFEVQRKTVKNEKSQNVENQPYAMAYVEVLGQTLYDHGHPYSWPVIGYVDDLDRANLDDLKGFFMRWYGPNNAVLAVSGDVNPEEVIDMVDKYFSPINRGPEVKKLKVHRTILPQNRYASYEDNIYLPLTLMVYPTVPNYHRDEAPLDVLAVLMGGDNNSILYKNFVKTEDAIQANVGHPCRELAGEMQIAVFAYPDLSFDDVEEKIMSSIEEFSKDGVTDDGVERIKMKIKSGMINSTGSIAGKAGLISSWNTFLNKPYNMQNELDRYDAVTKDDVIRVFNKYINHRNACIVNVSPKDPMSKDSVKSFNPYAGMDFEEVSAYQGLSYTKPVDDFDRSNKPGATVGKAPVVPIYYTQTFENGLEIIGTQFSETPKVIMLLEIAGGNLLMYDNPKKMGLATFTADLMDEGTEKYTTEEISAELDRLGSTIIFSAGMQSTQVFIECFANSIEPTMKLLEEKLFHPRFDEEDFNRVKKQRREAIKQNTRVANSQAIRAYNSLIYGGTILGQFMNIKTLKKLTLEDLKNFYESNYSPSVSRLTIVGAVPESEVISALGFLKNWTVKPVKLPEVIEIPEKSSTKMYIVHKPFAPQSVMMIGHIGMPYDATGDYFKATVMNYVLGGSFNSRINLNLREDKGFTYGARSGFSGNKYPGTFTVSTSVRTSATDSALKEIMMELNNYVESGITEEELSYTKNSILNNDALNYETSFQKAGFLSQIIRYKLQRDYIY
ncbi:MAG: insulinase family protein, partial [Bacteroidetes bacterium]|nr:insulinase family protein [Bacteroidota bacterium]